MGASTDLSPPLAIRGPRQTMVQCHKAQRRLRLSLGRFSTAFSSRPGICRAVYIARPWSSGNLTEITHSFGVPVSHLHKLSARFEEASQKYAASNGIERTDEWFLLKLQEELGEVTQVWLKLTGRGRPKKGAQKKNCTRPLKTRLPICWGIFSFLAIIFGWTSQPQSNASGAFVLRRTPILYPRPDDGG